MGRLALDILNDVADALSWTQLSTIEGDLSAYGRKLVRALNRVLRTLSSLDDFFFLRAESQIVTIAPYITGTATVISNLVLVGGVGTAWTTAMEGRAFAIGGDSLVYRIVQVDSPIQLRINLAYQGTTGSFNYTIAQDRYDLPADFDRPIGDWTNFFATESQRMLPISPNEFLDRRRRRNTGIQLDEPTAFTVWGYDDQIEHRTVVLDPWPSAQRTLVFPYQKVHPEIKLDGDKVLFPLRNEALITEAVLYILRRDVEDDPQAQTMLIDFLSAKNDALAKRELGSEAKRITPSTARRFRENLRWGHRRGRVDWGPIWDRKSFYDVDGVGR